jgi:hypothetical protein
MAAAAVALAERLAIYAPAVADQVVRDDGYRACMMYTQFETCAAL